MIAIKTPTRVRRTVTLCFHGIGEPGRILEPGEERFWVENDRFADILSAVHSLPALGEITFDDSNESDYTHALPALLGLSLTATFFVITDRLDTPGSLSRPQLDLLHLAGMPIGTHGMTHRPWRGLARDGLLEAELVESCDALTEVIHRSISSAAFPQGDYDRRVLSTLRRLGFTRAYSVDEGSSRPSSWLHSRYTVVSSDTPDSVIARIEKPDRSFVESAARSGRRVMKGLR